MTTCACIGKHKSRNHSKAKLAKHSARAAKLWRASTSTFPADTGIL